SLGSAALRLLGQAHGRDDAAARKKIPRSFCDLDRTFQRLAGPGERRFTGLYSSLNGIDSGEAHRVVCAPNGVRIRLVLQNRRRSYVEEASSCACTRRGL